MKGTNLYRKEEDLLKINMSSLHGAISDLKQVLTDSEEHSSKEYAFHTFVSKNHPYRLAAVDGSHHNLHGTNFVFSTLRAGYLVYREGKLFEEQIDSITTELIMNNDSSNGFLMKHEEYYHRITGEIPNSKLEFDKATERIRSLMEWEKIKDLIDLLGENDMIIFDGSFISGKISTNHEFFEELKRKAIAKGISLIGFSKDTSLSIDSAPIPVVLQQAAATQFPGKNWYVEYEDSYFVKFSKTKDLIFRLDVILPDHLDIEELLCRLGAYCFDHATLGYPYPMQKIHDSVRISEMERDYCYEVFKSECLKANVPYALFDKMFSIYHDQLDKLSFGR